MDSFWFTLWFRKHGEKIVLDLFLGSVGWTFGLDLAWTLLGHRGLVLFFVWTLLHLVLVPLSPWILPAFKHGGGDRYTVVP